MKKKPTDQFQWFTLGYGKSVSTSVSNSISQLNQIKSMNSITSLFTNDFNNLPIFGFTLTSCNCKASKSIFQSSFYIIPISMKLPLLWNIDSVNTEQEPTKKLDGYSFNQFQNQSKPKNCRNLDWTKPNSKEINLRIYRSLCPEEATESYLAMLTPPIRRVLWQEVKPQWDQGLVWDPVRPQELQFTWRH